LIGDTDDPNSNILRDLPERLNVVKRGITPDVQQAYLEYADSINPDEYAGHNAAVNGQKLLSAETSPDEKKKCLILLAREGTAEACLMINKFVETADQDLADWAILALETCWLLTESRLFDKEMGMLISGLGGEDGRLRYFFVVPSKDGLVLTDAHQKELEQAFARACNRFDSIMEKFQVHRDHITLLLLIPQDVAVATVIEGGIAESNQNSRLLHPDYFVTNTNIPTDEEILHYVRHLTGD
jgi:REP element-mobilizing transposase RayT